MITAKPTPQNGLADQAALAADQAIRSAQRSANETLDRVADGVQDLRQDAGPLLNRAADQASALAQRGAAAVRAGSDQVRDRARRVSASTARYINDEPVKAILIAAAAGATLLAIVRLFGRSRDRA